MFFDEVVDDILLQRGEDFDILLGIIITDIQPELIEGIWCCSVAIEPDITTFCLTKLLTISLCNQWTSKAVCLCFIAKCTTNKFGTSSHVTPLVITTQLQLNTVLLILIEEVVTLQKLIGKLGKAKSIASLTIQTLLHTILSHHIVDGNMLTNQTSEVEEGEVLHPVIVVNHLSLVRLVAIKVKELAYLLFNSLLIMVKCFSIKKVTLLTLARRVTNHTSSTTHEEIRFMSATLQMTQHHDTTEVSDVQRVSCWVSTQVS